MKLRIIVPYRDRESHLTKFRDGINSYFKDKKIKYELIIVEQSDDKPFNRGKLLNIGFIKAKQLKIQEILNLNQLKCIKENYVKIVQSYSRL